MHQPLRDCVRALGEHAHQRLVQRLARARRSGRFHVLGDNGRQRRGDVDVGLAIDDERPGTGVGPSSNGTCSVANSTSSAVAGSAAQLTANANPGTYCVRVSDAGGLTATSTVTVTVAHS